MSWTGLQASIFCNKVFGDFFYITQDDYSFYKKTTRNDRIENRELRVESGGVGKGRFKAGIVASGRGKAV